MIKGNIIKLSSIRTDGVAVFLMPAAVLWSSGSSLRLTVHSQNDKGASERVLLQALSYQDPERRTDGSQSTMAGVSSGAFLAIVITVLFCSSVAVLVGYFLRKRRSGTVTKQQTPELQLNAADGQYVVAYTLKPAKQTQPDILNPPPDGSPPIESVEAVKNGALNSDEWTSERSSNSHEQRNSLASPKSTSSKATLSTATLSRREHLIAEEIPGPESCV